ncbi:hypothetical protein BgiMline_021948 [Biomphalaria glabrata]|uniref:Uncharacterized protein LOC106068483 n=1 Tax=Biomphalaria glabrata TaxID=6526 RepID=A0A9U8EDM2_BIOGL|nr:uncharacterized protein LOC106068483 [Biomphalaria glabrata]KAI8734277.1 hypothetical protein BgiMline_028504 [Biomphalaria glabrata]
MEIMEKMEAALDKGVNKKDLLQLVELELNKAGLKTASQTLSTTGESTTSFTTETVSFDASGMLHDIFNQLTEYGVEMDAYVQAMKEHQVALRAELQLLVESQKKSLEQKLEEYSTKSQKQMHDLLEDLILRQSKVSLQDSSRQEILLALGKIQDDVESHKFLTTDAFRKETNVLKKKMNELTEAMETGFSMVKTNINGLKDSARLMERNIQKLKLDMQQQKNSAGDSVQMVIAGPEDEKKGEDLGEVSGYANIPFPLNQMDNMFERSYSLPFQVFSCPNLNLPTSFRSDEVSWLPHPLCLLTSGFVVISYLFMYWNSSPYSEGGQSLWHKWFK